ncbi:glycosyltransferase family 4 protein [Flavobacterium marginilacus]|uniref:glycosyltransferase family 4 protein n=1 Tax=Flavobacterium marginilacus TaxID=3003256 RepID=UPI00248E3C25|nr:glycosyltransferase family 4 protein [Flavobacterium marginilacus]
MRILWFTNTPSLYDQGKHSYHGGGWIESLEELLQKDKSIELAVSFFHRADQHKLIKEETTYYPILRESGRKNLLNFIVNKRSGKLESEHIIIPKLLDVIDDFRPDVIHVFGTEEIFSSVQTYTKIPVVIHLQGLLNPYVNAYFPSGHNSLSFLFSPFFSLMNIIGLGNLSGYKRFKNQATREAVCLRRAKYVMGRTEWDKRVAKIYNPDISYFHVDEVLRSHFYNNKNERKTQRSKIIIVSTLSPTIYKGIDVILKTANLLKNETKIDFEWSIIGLNDDDKLLKYFISSTKIEPEKVNLKFIGKKTPDELKEILLQTSIFIHPSYIDNSPNSVCEAQIMGVPVIACNVGGISSLIDHKETGILVPSNGVFEIVSWVVQLSRDQELLNLLSQNGKFKAQLRHNQIKIIEELISVYKTIKDS